MPKGSKPILDARALTIKRELNDLEREGYRLNAAIPIVAKRYYLSNRVVESDYFRKLDIEPEYLPANPPPTR